MSDKSKSILRFILMALGVFIFQVLFYQLSLVIIQAIAKHMVNTSNDYLLMIHHTIEFVLVFIPTFIIHRLKKLDFGYHFKEIKKAMLFLAISSGFGALISIISVIDGARYSFSLSSLVFQLFFSGLGEEILYRSLPLVLFTLAYGNDTTIKIGKKISIDFGIIVSALFFSLAHISFQFGYSGISFSYLQLFCSFVCGIIFGYAYKKTNSIWICMGLHGIYNLIVVSIPMIFSLF